MKKSGFNRYPSNMGDEEDSFSDPSNQPNQNHPQFNLMNQLSNFAPGNNGFNDTMIVTLFQIVQQQSQALQSLMTKVEAITQKTVELTEKIKELKKSKNQERENNGNEGKKVAMKNQTVKATGDILEASSLIKILFGSEKRYDYRLRLAQKLDLPLFRERNFFLEIELCDIEGRVIKNSNKIPLSLALYSSENPPKFIEKNTAGNKILKGYIEQSLHQGICRFQKIQIREVTSHFRNGWVFIVIIPCMTPLGSALTSSESYVDYTKIEPLVLEKVVVKAKKLKETKREGGEQVEGEAYAEQAGEDMQIEEGIKNQEVIYSDQK